MAYNLQSLITILQQILNPEQEHWILDHYNKAQLESLLQKAAALMQILENSSAPKIESLESRIRDAAHKAEDLIESHMVDQMLRHKGMRFSHLLELDSAIIKVLEVREEMKMSNDDLQQEEQAKFALMKTALLLEVMEEMKMSSGSSSSGAALTGMQNDDLQQAISELEKLLEAMKMLSAILSSNGAELTGMQIDDDLQQAISGLKKLMEEMKMSIGSSSSGPELTGMQIYDDLQQAISELEKLLEEMKMSSGSSSSSGTALTKDDEPQQEEQALSDLKKLLREMVMEEKMSRASSSSSGPALTGMQSKLEIHEGTRFTFVTPDLQEVTRQLDSAMEQVVKLMAEHKISSTASSSSVAAFLPDPTSKNVVVGFDKDLFQLKDRLTGMQSQQLEIIPIVGMGGIGKTTLARKLYDDPLIVSHFDICAWTTISQDYNVQAILLGLLRRPNEKLSNELIECKDNEHLIKSLYQRLYARRYLIVLDDIWSTECWDDIKWCFPDYNNGSRIVLTTRESHVARNVGTGGWQHELQLLKESESWNLLHRTVFGEEDCPNALEEIGRKIARDCGGLPLAINVIGGVLSKAEREIDVWERVAKDVRATIAETNNHEFSNVLSLSYNHLPNNLKPCFLYMGAFPEDYEIKPSRLIQLWVAEGFLKSNGDKSLEEEAKDYLSALVERNLVVVRRKKYSGKPYGYGMHDLLREVCIRKASEEKFLLHVKNGSKVRLDKVRRVSVETLSGMKDVDAYASAVARSLICAAPNPMLCEEPSLPFSKLRLVRVLDVYDMEFPEFPREIYQLVNLRYLAISWKSGNIPTGISRLRNLQTLIARVEWGDVPSEIWEMSELRHLKFSAQMYIEEGYMINFAWKKLQTISYWVRITDPLIRRGFFESIPNIKNLGLFFHELPSTTQVVDLTHLHKLQTLRCTCISRLDKDVLQKLRFPSNLRKLTLYKCVIFGRFMRTLCALPNLEVLKIVECAFDEEEWEASEGDEFESLQYLELQDLNLVRWRADETNFPRLEQLLIYKCSSLEEIPSGIGEIPILQLIYLYKCSPSAVASAEQIQQQQQSEFDNYDLKVQILN